MTLTTTIDRKSVFGNMKIVIGHCANDSTGGDVATGLRRVEMFIPVGLGAAAVEIAVNETFPLDSGDVTVVTENAIAFSWMAIGR